MFNFYFVEKDGKKQQDTVKLFEAIQRETYEVFTSKYVHHEIAGDTPVRYKKMKKLIDEYVQSILDFDQRVLNLADIYIKNGIIPEKFVRDAHHIAMATVNRLDFVVSYNMGHIVKLKTMIGTGFTNIYHGYQKIGLCTPSEVVEYGRN